MGFRQIGQLMTELHRMAKFENTEPEEKPLSGETGFKVAKTILR